MRTCVRFAPMIGSKECELPEDEARALAAHLGACPRCRAIARDLAATEGLLGNALMARANSRDFAPFVDQVMARVGARPRPAFEQVRRRPSLLAFLRGHGRLTAVAAAAVVGLLAAVSAFLYVHRSAERPEELAALEVDLEGGNIVLQTSDGPVVLIEPDDETGG
ncbi:MAG TPA: zf-HC2 domain-containing protein [Anaeromyxobacter sp.]|nr:zf-HC2 domain-containing protein [Anaeromyxobacter sp.]